jgi:leucyl aminopeptidase
MRTCSLVVTAVLGAFALTTPARADDAPVIISIGADALATARAATADAPGFEVLATDDHVAVLAVDASQLDELAEAMHAQHGRCGGFMVHPSLDDALTPPAPAVRPAPIDYTLDRPQVVRAVLPAIEGSHILTSIERLSGMRNRYYQSASGAEASIWLRDLWRSFSTRPDVTVELVDHGYAQRSVVLTIPGTTRADEVVVIGGHLDSIAPGGRDGAAPGADDDASGIATLTEVARVLLARDVRPARTLQFIAYAAEEVGLRGSLSIVRDYRKRGVRVVGVLQLDMTNYQGSDRDIWLIADHTDAAQNRFVGRLIDAYVGATWGYDACGYACSDHAAWHRAGIPASMPFEARFRDHNRAIHTNRDTLERSAGNVAHAIKFARLGAAFAIELGRADLGAADAATVDRPAGRTAAVAAALAALAALVGVALARAWRPRTGVAP